MVSYISHDPFLFRPYNDVIIMCPNERFRPVVAEMFDCRQPFSTFLNLLLNLELRQDISQQHSSNKVKRWLLLLLLLLLSFSGPLYT